MVQNMTLVKIAAIGGVATVTMGLAARMKINNDIRRTEYYKDAMKTLRGHKASVFLLGEPIKDKMIDVGDDATNYSKANEAHYEVPVSGSKERGRMYFWATKDDENKWSVKRIELELKKDPTKRLLVKSTENV